MSHTGEIKNCSQAVTGVSEALNVYTPIGLFPTYLPTSYLSSALCLSFLPVCSRTRLFWCQTSWPSTTAGELGGDCVAASPRVFTVVKIRRSSCHLRRQPFPCRLAGGLPPYASVYPTWVDCWRHLSREVSKRRLTFSVVHSDGRMQRHYHSSLCACRVIPSMFTLCLNVYFCLLLVSGQHEQR